MKIDIRNIIGTSEFRGQTARVFDEVENGATFLITRGSKPIAIIQPVPEELAPNHAGVTYPSGEDDDIPPANELSDQSFDRPVAEPWKPTNHTDPIDVE